MSSEQYFAQIDENNIVTYVAVVTAEFMSENPERYPGNWVETFFNTPGKIYAGVGFIYLPAVDDFMAPPEPKPEPLPDNAA
jgi:hypothetical protein